MSEESYDYTLKIQQGATLEISLVWKDDTAQHLPIDVTSYTAKFQIRDNFEKLIISTSSFSASDNTPGCSITLGGALGTIVVVVPEALTQTSTFSPANGSNLYRYGLTVKSPNNTISLLLGGRVELIAGAVQWP